MKKKGVILDRSLHVNPYTPEGKKKHDRIMRETFEALGLEIPESLRDEGDREVGDETTEPGSTKGKWPMMSS
jgi:hypothetical protein